MPFILIVDDQAINREFLVTLLSYSDYQLQEATDGKDALEKVKKEKPALVITDLFMPIMNGYDLAQAMRADPNLQDIPIIFYTATYRSEEARLLADSCNVKWVLTKPCDPEVILETVNKALSTIDKAIHLKKIPTETQLQSTQKLTGIKKFQKRKISENLAQYLENEKSLKKLLEILIKKNNEDTVFQENGITNFLENVSQLNKFNDQLFALTTLSLELISEKDKDKLVRLFCLGAKAILEVRYCGFFLLNNQGGITEYFIITDNDKFCNLDKNYFANHIITQLISSDDLLHIPRVADAQVTFSADHPVIQSFLGIPLFTTSRTYGGLYFCNKLNNSSFTENDEFITRMLAAEIAVLLENIELYTIIQRHAATLQLEISERKTAEIELKKSEKLFRQFAENIKEVFWHTTPSLDKMIYVSPAYEEIWQRNRQELYDNSLAWLDSVVEEDKQKVLDTFLPNDSDMSLEYQIKRPDGSRRKIYVRGFLIRDIHDEVESKIGIATDITEFNKTKQRDLLQREIPKIISTAKSLKGISSKLLETICNTLNCIVGEIWLFDKNKSILYCLEGWSFKKDELKAFMDERLELSFASGVGFLGLILQTKKSTWLSNPAHSHFPNIKFVQAFNIQTVFGSPIIFQDNVIGALQFFSEEKLPEDPVLLNVLDSIGAQLGEFISYTHTSEQLNYMARHDVLTGFLNRATWEEELNAFINTRTPELVAIFLFEIDRFKLIIDTLGHDGSDDLLTLVAHKIRENLTMPEDLLARLSLDKFAIALTNVKSIEQANYFASRLISLFKVPLSIKGKEVFITLSVGASFYPQNGQNSHSLLINTEIALDRTKEQGGNSYSLFTDEKQVSVLNKLDLENQLRHAMLHEQFVIYYQPQVEMKSSNITGFEALLRWKHPEKGLLNPAEFLPILEQSDLIASVGEWVLREACHQIIRYQVPIAVNLSIFQFRPRYNLVAFIGQLINETKIDPALLDLEITEGLMMNDVKRSLETLEGLRNLCVRFSLDDFGTGYCSLNYLKHFSVDRVKIDKSFVDGLPHDKNNKAISSAVLALAHGLGIKVIAEGVETKEQFKFLLEAGCDEIQGYYYAKPLPASEIEGFIKSKQKLKY